LRPEEVVVKKPRKPKPDYFGLRELERIILHELEAAEETTEKRNDIGPSQKPQRPTELNPETVAKSAAKESTDAAEDWSEHNDLFTDEEKKFISEAVEWLGLRENRDLILHRIMRGIDEVRPFPAAAFQPQSQETGVAAADVSSEAH
jgi:hypothetical protein